MLPSVISQLLRVGSGDNGGRSDASLKLTVNKITLLCKIKLFFLFPVWLSGVLVKFMLLSRIILSLVFVQIDWPAPQDKKKECAAKGKNNQVRFASSRWAGWSLVSTQQ